MQGKGQSPDHDSLAANLVHPRSPERASTNDIRHVPSGRGIKLRAEVETKGKRLKVTQRCPQSAQRVKKLVKVNQPARNERDRALVESERSGVVKGSLMPQGPENT